MPSETLFASRGGQTVAEAPPLFLVQNKIELNRMEYSSAKLQRDNQAFLASTQQTTKVAINLAICRQTV